MNEVEKYNQDNQHIIRLFIKVFSSEIMPTLHTNEALAMNLINSYNKEQYLFQVYQSSSFLLLGYNNKPIEVMVDDYEFYLYILSYFNKFGKIYRETLLSDDSYVEKVSISYFNKNSNEIDVKQYIFKDSYERYQENIHLYLLLSIKSIVTNILSDLVSINLTIDDIKYSFPKFKELYEGTGDKSN